MVCPVVQGCVALLILYGHSAKTLSRSSYSLQGMQERLARGGKSLNREQGGFWHCTICTRNLLVCDLRNFSPAPTFLHWSLFHIITAASRPAISYSLVGELRGSFTRKETYLGELWGSFLGLAAPVISGAAFYFAGQELRNACPQALEASVPSIDLVGGTRTDCLKMPKVLIEFCTS